MPNLKNLAVNTGIWFLVVLVAYILLISIGWGLIFLMAVFLAYTKPIATDEQIDKAQRKVESKYRNEA